MFSINLFCGYLYFFLPKNIAYDEAILDYINQVLALNSLNIIHHLKTLFLTYLFFFFLHFATLIKIHLYFFLLYMFLLLVYYFFILIYLGMFYLLFLIIYHIFNCLVFLLSILLIVNILMDPDIFYTNLPIFQ